MPTQEELDEKIKERERRARKVTSAAGRGRASIMASSEPQALATPGASLYTSAAPSAASSTPSSSDGRTSHESGVSRPMSSVSDKPARFVSDITMEEPTFAPTLSTGEESSPPPVMEHTTTPAVSTTSRVTSTISDNPRAPKRISDIPLQEPGSPRRTFNTNEVPQPTLSEDERIKERERMARSVPPVSFTGSSAPEHQPSDAQVTVASESRATTMLDRDAAIKQQARTGRVGSAASDGPSVIYGTVPSGATSLVSETSSQAEQDARMKENARAVRLTSTTVPTNANVVVLAEAQSTTAPEPEFVQTTAGSSTNRSAAQVQAASEIGRNVMLQEDERIKQRARQGRPESFAEAMPPVVEATVQTTPIIGSSHMSPAESADERHKTRERRARRAVGGQPGAVESNENLPSKSSSGVGSFSASTMSQQDQQLKHSLRGSRPQPVQEVPPVAQGSVQLGTPGDLGRESSSDDRIKARERRNRRGASGRNVGGDQTATSSTPAARNSSASSFGSKSSAAQAPSADTSDAPVGAISVFTNGMAVQQRPATLSQPSNHTTPELFVPPPSQLQPPSALSPSQPPTRDIEEPVSEKEDKGEATTNQPWCKRNMVLLLVVVVVAALGAGAGVGVALSGGDSSPSGPKRTDPPTQAPTSMPTQAPWDEDRKEVSFLYISNLTDASILHDDSTPQYKAWKWLVQEDHFSQIASPSNVMSDEEVTVMMSRYVLAVMYYSLDGENWENSDWLNSATGHCGWNTPIVRCKGGAVSAIQAHAVQPSYTEVKPGKVDMRGDLPDELEYFSKSLSSFRIPSSHVKDVSVFTKNFTKLSVVELSGNPLESVLPLCRVTSLVTLHIPECGLDGTMPAEIRDLSNLKVLSFFGNQFSGTLTGDYFTSPSFQRLVAATNSFDGNIMEAVRVPSPSNMLSLYMGSNNFTGSLTSDIGSYTKLQHIRLEMNSITGPMPSELGLLTNLLELVLTDNTGVNGTIPDTFANLESLTKLNLVGTSIVGTVPAAVCDLAGLKEILYSPDGELECDCLTCDHPGE